MKDKNRLSNLLLALTFLFALAGELSVLAEEAASLEDTLLELFSEPGHEFAARKIAIENQDDSKSLINKVLREAPKTALKPCMLLIKGDLLMISGELEEALACYREVVGLISSDEAKGWQEGYIPLNYYMVETPRISTEFSEGEGKVFPFYLGSGSHRDNWLIRRFIALEAWEDAAAEFERVWQIHHRRIGKEQFDGLALQFAVDYAYFLKRQNIPIMADDILIEPLFRLDMDVNPNLKPLNYHLQDKKRDFYSPRVGGLSRKEYLRIVHDALKDSGSIDRLTGLLQQQVDDGNYRALRVYARIMYLEGDMEKTLALEFSYLKRAGFDPLTVMYRRGLVYEEYGQLKEAAESFESTLSLPYTPPQLPDQSEEASAEQTTYTMFMPAQIPDTTDDKTTLHAQILERLQRLYGALGETDKALNILLRHFDINPLLLKNVDVLEQTITKFRADNRESDILVWIQKKKGESDDPIIRANLAWIEQDYVETARQLGIYAAEHNEVSLDIWKRRFRDTVPEFLPQLMKALSKANPQDCVSHLEWLDLTDNFHGEEVIQSLELLLSEPCEHAFRSMGKGSYYNLQIQFANHFDLAYRLMRLYEDEDEGEIEKLISLGLRIAGKEKPFEMYVGRYNSFERPYFRDACLALTIQYADTPTLNTLENLLVKDYDAPALAQLKRKTASEWPPKTLPAVGWANLPEGVSALVNHDEVLSLYHDEQFLYAGMPWGIAVYDHAGILVTRIALEEAALHLVVGGDYLWAGTAKGLNRISRYSWETAYIPLDRCIPELYQDYHSIGVCCLAYDGKVLWIGTQVDIQYLDLTANSLRIFTSIDLCVDSGRDWDRIFFDGQYVWASGEEGSRRYNRNRCIWEKVLYQGSREVQLFELTGDMLWGQVELNDKLGYRPCIIDCDTLEITPVFYESNDRCSNTRDNGFDYFGTWDGKAGFGSYFYDPESGVLRPYLSGFPPLLHDSRTPGLPRMYCQPDEGFYTGKHLLSYTKMDWLPDGTGVLGQRRGGIRYRYPKEDRWSKFQQYDYMNREVGGLFLVSSGSGFKKISSVCTAESLPGVSTVAIMQDKKSGLKWVATNYGLAILNASDQTVASYTYSDGLCDNCITEISTMDNNIYFSTGTNGLIQFEPKTRVFTSFFQSDGLATNNLVGVEAQNGLLKLTYGLERVPYESRQDNKDWRQYPPGYFDPKHRTIESGGAPCFMDDAMIYQHKNEKEDMPYLGGSIISKTSIGEKTYICGTRGLVILDNDTPPPMGMRTIEPELIKSEQEILLAEARETTFPVQMSKQELESYLNHENPFIRANALRDLLRPVINEGHGKDYLPLLTKCIQDPCYQVRCTALVLLENMDDSATIAPLKIALDDPDQYIHGLAAVVLLKYGVQPDIKYFREILEKRNYHSMPYGAEFSTGVILGEEQVYLSLSKYADAKIFKLLIEFPPHYSTEEFDQIVYSRLGESLRKHSDAIQVLLGEHEELRLEHYRKTFLTKVFMHAGKEILPILHEALQNDDRVIQSNAARACGSIADPFSIQPLLALLDSRSRLVLASAVWALGELKVKEALPRLVELYIDSRNEQERRMGAFTRNVGQFGWDGKPDYDNLRDFDRIAADWEILKAFAFAEPVEENWSDNDEDWLSPKHVLTAVRNIGPAASQDFYRILAREKDQASRIEAAIQLASCSDADCEINVPILQNLLADKNLEVRVRAATSLLILGYDTGKETIVEYLDTLDNDYYLKRLITDLQKLECSECLSLVFENIDLLIEKTALSDTKKNEIRKVIEEIKNRDKHGNY